ncbi:MAG: glycosyltransferase [Pseudomonadota bacterium]
MSLPNDLRTTLKQAKSEGQLTEGLAALSTFTRQFDDMDQQKAHYWLGLNDLKSREAADAFYDSLAAPIHRHDQIAYAKFLYFSGDPIAARHILNDVSDLGPMASELAQSADNQVNVMTEFALSAPGEIAATLFTEARRTMRQINGHGCLFYTGQLGPGGAEGQFAKTAVAFQTNGTVGPISVAVRHLDPRKNAAFHLPTLTDAGITPFAVCEAKAAVLALPPKISALLAALPRDLIHPVTALAQHLKKRAPQSVFLWQDGGVLIGALAASLAGVPNILTSFRGLPPNIRPNLHRPEYLPVYRALVKDRQATLSANNTATAQAYSDWLGEGPTALKTIPNAISTPSISANHKTKTLWHKIKSQSQTCTQTVIGVFRIQAVKQPELWFETALQTIKARPDIRFIHVGPGDVPLALERQIQTEGKDHIFRIGLSSDVGFWINKSDIMMHLARFEGLPNALAEAHLLGCPILATPAGGTSEVVIEGQTGRLLPDTQPQTDLVKAVLLDLLDQPNLLDAYGKAAQKHTKAVFDPDRVYRQMATYLGPPTRDAA